MLKASKLAICCALLGFASPGALASISSSVQTELNKLPAGVDYGILVSDLETGRPLESSRAEKVFTPASTLKVVTGACLLRALQGNKGWLSTELTVPASELGRSKVSSLSMRGSADPSLSTSDLKKLAKQAYASGLRSVAQLRLDNKSLNASSFTHTAYGMPATTLRLIEWEDQNLSAEQMQSRMGLAMLKELDLAGIKVESGKTAEAAPYTAYKPTQQKDKNGKPLPIQFSIPKNKLPEQAVASVQNNLTNFIWETLRPSNNGRAEALLAVLAAKPYADGTLGGALSRETQMLKQMGINTTGMVLEDGSGLSTKNKISPHSLVNILKVMYDLPYPLKKAALASSLYTSGQNAFAEALPLAGTGKNLPNHGGRGGTMAMRLINTGLIVKAKTGTLAGVSNLSGYITAKSGKTLAFAIMMNGPESSSIPLLRSVQDKVLLAIAKAY